MENPSNPGYGMRHVPSVAQGRAEIQGPHILPLIFTKRLCDVFDDELNRIAAEVGSRRKAFQLARADHKLVRFYLPLVPDDFDQPVWSVIHLRSSAKSAKASPATCGASPGKSAFAGHHRPRGLQRHHAWPARSRRRPPLQPHRGSQHQAARARRRGSGYYRQELRVPDPQVRRERGQSAGEFYTPPEVGTIMSRVLQPEPGMEIYDPTWAPVVYS